MIRPPPKSLLFPNPPLFRSRPAGWYRYPAASPRAGPEPVDRSVSEPRSTGSGPALGDRSEEHTSELQSLTSLICRLLLDKKKKTAHSISYFELEPVTCSMDS